MFNIQVSETVTYPVFPKRQVYHLSVLAMNEMKTGSFGRFLFYRHKPAIWTDVNAPETAKREFVTKSVYDE